MVGCENVVESLKTTKCPAELARCDHLGFVVKKQAEFVCDASDVKLKRWFGLLHHHLGNEGDETLGVTTHLRQLVHEAIPMALRPVVYPKICGVTRQMIKDYQLLGDTIKEPDRTVEKDLLRTLPNNIFFMRIADEGTRRLRRVLNRTKDNLPEYGYCQGMGLLVAHLLLIMDEAEVFYICIFILKRQLPANYFSPDLAGLRAEQAVLRVLVKQKLPRLDRFLIQRKVELSFFSIQWLVTLFAGVLPGSCLFALWDRLLVDGIVAVHSVALSLLRHFEPELAQVPDTADVFKFLADLPCRIQTGVEFNSLEDLAPLVGVSDEQARVIRKRQIQVLAKEKNEEREQKEIRLKAEDVTPIKQNYVNLSPHLKQAEVVYSIRHAVDAICRHFGLDINILLDYDADQYHPAPLSSLYGLVTTPHQPAQSDELELQVNDVVQVNNDTGEYWHGANQRTRLVGYFPPYCVRPLKTRLGYDARGDVHRNDDCSKLIFDLLLSAFKFVLAHGAEPHVQHRHPFELLVHMSIEHKNRKIKCISQSINRSFNLGEPTTADNDVLDEWLAIVRMLTTADYATLDEKLYTFILFGLNRGQLHLYWKSIATQDKLVAKWYNNSSFVKSPGKNQITCLLIPLSRLPFYFQENERSVTCMKNNDYIEELAMKHHLFSWQL